MCLPATLKAANYTQKDTVRMGADIKVCVDSISNDITYFRWARDDESYEYLKGGKDSLVFHLPTNNHTSLDLRIFQDKMLTHVFSISLFEQEHSDYVHIYDIKPTLNRQEFDYLGLYKCYIYDSLTYSGNILINENESKPFLTGMWQFYHNSSERIDTIFYDVPQPWNMFPAFSAEGFYEQRKTSGRHLKYTLNESRDSLLNFSEIVDDTLLFSFSREFSLVLSEVKANKEYLEVFAGVRRKIPFKGHLTLYYHNGSKKASGDILFDETPEEDYYKIGEWKYYGEKGALLLSEMFINPVICNTEPKLNYKEYNVIGYPFGIEPTIKNGELISVTYYYDGKPVEYFKLGRENK